jgi:hypothetical protein
MSLHHPVTLGANMRKYEARTTDRVLIDLLSARDDLSMEIRVLNDGDVIDPAVLGTLRRNLGLLDLRISRRTGPIAG